MSVKEMGFANYRELSFQLYLSHSPGPKAQWNEDKSRNRTVVIAVSYGLWLTVPQLRNHLYVPIDSWESFVCIYAAFYRQFLS